MSNTSTLTNHELTRAMRGNNQNTKDNDTSREDARREYAERVRKDTSY